MWAQACKCHVLCSAGESLADTAVQQPTYGSGGRLRQLGGHRVLVLPETGTQRDHLAGVPSVGARRASKRPLSSTPLGWERRAPAHGVFWCHDGGPVSLRGGNSHPRRGGDAPGPEGAVLPSGKLSGGGTLRIQNTGRGDCAFPTVPLSMVSLTCSQPLSKNIQWKIPGILRETTFT